MIVDLEFYIYRRLKMWDRPSDFHPFEQDDKMIDVKTTTKP